MAPSKGVSFEVNSLCGFLYSTKYRSSPRTAIPSGEPPRYLWSACVTRPRCCMLAPGTLARYRLSRSSSAALPYSVDAFPLKVLYSSESTSLDGSSFYKLPSIIQTSVATTMYSFTFRPATFLKLDVVSSCLRASIHSGDPCCKVLESATFTCSHTSFMVANRSVGGRSSSTMEALGP